LNALDIANIGGIMKWTKWDTIASVLLFALMFTWFYNGRKEGLEYSVCMAIVCVIASNAGNYFGKYMHKKYKASEKKRKENLYLMD
jgi:hypothetical protein